MPQRIASSPVSIKSGAQIFRLYSTKNGDTATMARAISPRNSSSRRLAQRQNGYNVTTLISAINPVTQSGSRVGAHSAAIIQVKSGALPTPFELIRP